MDHTKKKKGKKIAYGKGLLDWKTLLLGSALMMREITSLTSLKQREQNAPIDCISIQ